MFSSLSHEEKGTAMEVVLQPVFEQVARLRFFRARQASFFDGTRSGESLH
jgi:hypothetical protein